MVERMTGSKSSNDIDDFVAAFLVEAYPSRTKAAEDRRAEWAEILEFSRKVSSSIRRAWRTFADA